MTDRVAADLSRHLGWMTEGHRYFLARLAQVSDHELLAPSALPGWTGRHILSHVGHNARAVRRLAHWAATGVPTPMYSGAHCPGSGDRTRCTLGRSAAAIVRRRRTGGAYRCAGQ